MSEQQANGGEPRRFQRRFVLYRRGVGRVAEGVRWTSGAVAIHWPGRPRSTSIWLTLDEVLDANCRDGLTELVWVDTEESHP